MARPTAKGLPQSRESPATQERAETRGSENRSSAFDGVDRGQQVNRDYDRGRSSWGDRSFRPVVVAGTTAAAAVVFRGGGRR
jgi:hypothetical protein